MADLTITAGDIIPTSNTVIASGTAGAAITAGQPLYADASDGNKLKPAAHTNAATANVVGIAINSAPGIGQPVDYAVSGSLAMGTILASRTVYVLGSAAGKIAPAADLSASEFGTVLGISSSTSNLKVGIVASGVNA